MKLFYAVLSTIFLLISITTFSQNISHENPYHWKSVQKVGGGFVDGIIFHPSEENLRYARTDMGGAYRWNESEKRWIPLMDWVSYDDNNLMGVESIALDPNDPDRLYMACGTYTSDRSPDGEILISENRGETFQRVKVPFKMGGNENGRGNGERMAVDPANGNTIYLGTRHAGLWRSMNAGRDWQPVTTFPDIEEQIPDTLNEIQQRTWRRGMMGSGIVWVVFDPQPKTGSDSENIFVGVSLLNRENLFRSSDGGETWHPVPGHPQQYRPTQGVLSPDGNLYITYGDNPGPQRMRNGAVWRFNTKTEVWTENTPDKPEKNTDKEFGYASVSIDANNPKTLIVSTFHRPGKYGGEEIYRSTNRGDSWIPVFKTGAEFDYSIAPYTEFTSIHWMFDIEINPFNPDHAIFTTGFGGFETFNLSNADKNKKTSWSVYTRGIEETVPLEMCSPPEGAHLITAIGDYGGFVHWDLDKAAEGQYFTNPYFGNCDGIACAELKPQTLVRVGLAHGGYTEGGNIGYSSDFGESWIPVKMPNPEARHGSITVSPLGDKWIWTPQRQKPFITTNKGESWTMIDDLDENIRIVADRVNNDKFYAIDLFKGLLYTSSNGGKNFFSEELNLKTGTAKRGTFRGDRRGGQDQVYSTPGYENDLWIAAFDGLHHKPATKSNFHMMSGVTEIHGFGFGKAVSGSDYPALFLIGVIDGIRGIFRSDNKAKSWIRINDNQNQWGLLLHITGDPKKYGRAYIGTHGRGTLYGDIQ